MNMGGLFGGIAVGIGLSILMDGLTDASTPSPQQQQRQAQIRREQQQRREALRKAIEEQRRIQQERHNRLISSLMDASKTQLIDDPGEMALLDGSLEQMAADAGRIFDGTTDLDTFWMRNHDAWFSTLGYTAQPVSAQPMPVSDNALDYNEQQFEPLECVAAGPYGGQLCSFPNMRPPVLDVKTVEVQSPTSPADAPDIISGLSQSQGRSIYTFQRSWGNASVPGQQAPDVMTNLVNRGDQVIPGIQGQVAKLSQDQLTGVYTDVAKQIFNGLNQDLIRSGSTSLLLGKVPLAPLTPGSASPSLLSGRELDWEGYEARKLDVFRRMTAQTALRDECRSKLPACSKDGKAYDEREALRRRDRQYFLWGEASYYIRFNDLYTVLPGMEGEGVTLGGVKSFPHGGEKFYNWLKRSRLEIKGSTPPGGDGAAKMGYQKALNDNPGFNP